MFQLTKPSRREINAFIAESLESDLSYRYNGATQIEVVPGGYVGDHNQIQLGTGPEDWEKAKQAIRKWKMFEMPWVEICWPETPIQIGSTVAILVSHFGFYSLNAARIVYVIDEPFRFGFAYGTLADHGESGEERFMATMDRETSEVWYDLYAFSRPNHILSKLGYPLTRILQKRFAADSKAAMLRAMETIG